MLASAVFWRETHRLAGSHPPGSKTLMRMENRMLNRYSPTLVNTFAAHSLIELSTSLAIDHEIFARLIGRKSQCFHKR